VWKIATFYEGWGRYGFLYYLFQQKAKISSHRPFGEFLCEFRRRRIPLNSSRVRREEEEEEEEEVVGRQKSLSNLGNGYFESRTYPLYPKKKEIG